MNDQLANYFKSFNEQLTGDLGSRFDYPKLLSYGKRKKDVLKIRDDVFDIPWVNELADIVEKIKAIVENVNPKIDPSIPFKNSEFDTFEDRFIVYLIDCIASLLAATSSRFMTSTKKVSDLFIDHKVPFGEMSKLLAVELTNEKDTPYLKDHRRMAHAREVLGGLMDTNYYQFHKKCSGFDDECVVITDVLANEPLYRACYDYYPKLKDLLSLHFELPEPIRNIDYQNYAFLSLLLAFDERGFVLFGNSPEFDNKDYLLRVKNLKLARKNITVSISSDSDDHIDLLFEDNDEYLQKEKRQSRISLDLIPYLNKQLTSKEEASIYFSRKTECRYEKDYDNAFVITAIEGTQSSCTVISSPLGNPLDANLANMIESCLIKLKADSYTYSRFCPVCGGHVNRSNGNYACSVCSSKYMLLTDKNKDEIVWFKRLKNLEGK